MKKANHSSLLLCAGIALVMAACTYVTPKEQLSKDHFITVNLTKKDVRQNSKYDMKMDMNGSSSGMSGAGMGAALAVAIIPTIVLVEVAINALQGGDKIYVYPENYKEQYSQQLEWGENKVFVPEQMLREGGNLVFFAKGARVGSWTMKYDPEHPTQFVIDDVASNGGNSNKND